MDIVFAGFDDDIFAQSPRSYFTQDIIIKHLHFGVTQTILTRDVLIMGVHAFHHWSNSAYFRDFVFTAPRCSISFSIGNKLNITYANRLTALTMRSPQRVHLHIGSVIKPLWAQHKKPSIKVRNLIRSPLVILNKVSK